MASGAELLDEGEGFGALGFVGDDDVEIGGRLCRALGGGGRGFVDVVAEDDVAHAEADGGQIATAVAEVIEQAVVASAAGEGAVFFAAVENFKDEAGVVGETSDDGEVDFDVVAEPAGSEIAEDVAEVGWAPSGDEGAEFGGGEAVGGEFDVEGVGGFAFDLVDEGEDGAGVADIAFGEEAGPRAAVAQANDEVAVGKSKVAEDVDGEGDELGVGSGGGVADEVGVELDEFAESTFLRALVAKEGGDGKPL